MRLSLAGAGAYDAAGTRLDNLKALNFIFGPNGSGKTTISRVIEDAASYPGSSLTWVAGNVLEKRVYNKDFVAQHFDSESNIKGIYTFGGNVEVKNTIARLKKEADEIDGKLSGLKRNLNGDDSATGKQKECDTLEERFRDDIWNAKKSLGGLEQAFTGVNDSKAKFCGRYLTEIAINEAELRDVVELREEAATVFSNTLSPADALTQPDYTPLVALECAEILTKKIVGKDDVDIAAIIKKLGNSDWVQQGRKYFTALDDQCPFCQQRTDAEFRRTLDTYFDESYTNDLLTIDTLLNNYYEKSRVPLETYAALSSSPFLDQEAFDKVVTNLRHGIEGTVRSLESKKKEPSTPVSLKETKTLFVAVDAQINAANNKAKDNNDTIRNLGQRKQALTSKIWRRLFEDTKDIYDKYKTERGKLDGVIENLKAQIGRRTDELRNKKNKIEEWERQITSIKPTIEDINKLLKSFGFVNFHLVESSIDGFYEVKRPNGENAKNTLSEGEKSFITFLYFYHHIRGSFSASGATTNKIVVFDDPVSSLDADILFIVCNLIKGIVNEMRGDSSEIKQVFVLTHNIYFHKEVTFNSKRRGANPLRDETFWIIRKFADRSELVQSQDNPIKSSYELLWQEVRQKPPSDTTIQNVMRRILEHYFKFFGGIVPEDITQRFDGQEKIICGSLFSWINDGSHFANDDLFMSCDAGQVDKYLTVFRRIFEQSGHGGHYKMMMGIDVEQPGETEEAPVVEVATGEVPILAAKQANADAIEREGVRV